MKSMLERQDLILGGCLEKEEIVGTAAKLIKFCRLLICVVHDTKKLFRDHRQRIPKNC